MKPETVDWIEKAEGDWKVARRELQSPDPVWHVVCFLAQQCAEKYINAFLEEQNVPYGKTHDLAALVRATGGLLPQLDAMTAPLARLTTFGIAGRYPGLQADRDAAREAIGTAEVVRAAVRAALGCP